MHSGAESRRLKECFTAAALQVLPDRRIRNPDVLQVCGGRDM